MFTPVYQLFAKFACGCAVAFIVLLGLLHLLEPEYALSWHFISEYQLGKWGWMMSLAFGCLGLSCLFTVASLWRRCNIAGKIGLVMLVISAAGMFLAAINKTDPLNTPVSQWTDHGKLHQQAAQLDGIPVAAIFIIIGLIRKSNYWKSRQGILIILTLLTWAGIIVFIIAMIKYMPADRHFGPDNLLGWPNRMMIVTQAVWLAAIGYLALKQSYPANHA